jgi:hypothetical protein
MEAAVVKPAADEARKKNYIKIGSGRKTYYYVDLAVRYLQNESEIEMSGVGYGVPTQYNSILIFFFFLYS